MTVTFVIDSETEEGQHTVVLRRGDNVVELTRKDLIEIFQALKDMKKFFGPIA